MRRRQLDWNPMVKAIILFVIITCKILWPLCNLTFGLFSCYWLLVQYLQLLGQPRRIPLPTSGRHIQQSGTGPEVWMDWGVPNVYEMQKEQEKNTFKTPILMVVDNLVNWLTSITGTSFDLYHAFINSEKCWHILI